MLPSPPDQDCFQNYVIWSGLKQSTTVYISGGGSFIKVIEWQGVTVYIVVNCQS
jgi:hypothetical protein